MHIIILIVGVTIVGLFIFSFHQIIRKELEITFIGARKYSPKALTYRGCLNQFEWIIISDDAQRENLEIEGYDIPNIDFNRNYLIISRYKISKLYRKAFFDKCSGVPRGRPIFDKDNSTQNNYYFYLMPRIMLSQGVG